tara:strand:+ start:40 stop:1239 length:1200 start_codon:yes stop_codon:yes gene_type:complete
MSMEKDSPEIAQSLHIPVLRRKWQILALQIVSTAALLLLMKRMSEIYGPCSEQFIMDHSATSWCPSYEHTRGLMWLSNQSDLLIPDVLLGLGQTGSVSFIGPLVICVAATVAWAQLRSMSQEFQTRVRMGVTIVFIAWMALPFIFSWVIAMAFNGPHLPFGHENEALNHLDVLFSPFAFVLELVFLGIVFAPVLAGLVGIWGLSKRPISWAAGYYLVVIGIHAVLTFEPIVTEVDVGLRPLPTQIGEGTMFWGLVSDFATSLLEVAVLMLVFLESGSAAINHLEYAASLPEDTKRNAEYVRQFDNVVNAHLVHMVVTITLVALTTALALAFDDLMISFVGILEGTQWTGQVKESLELQMTYGKVISAGLFILVVAGMRYVIPWQSITGYVESSIAKLRA